MSGKRWAPQASTQWILRNLDVAQAIAALLTALQHPSSSGMASATAIIRQCHALLQVFCSGNPRNQRVVWDLLPHIERQLVRWASKARSVRLTPPPITNNPMPTLLSYHRLVCVFPMRSWRFQPHAHSLVVCLPNVELVLPEVVLFFFHRAPVQQPLPTCECRSINFEARSLCAPSHSRRCP